ARDVGELASLKPLIEYPRPHWVIWKKELVKGEWTKVPYQALNPMRKASTTDPSTWATFDQAMAALRFGDGIGFVLTDTEFAAFDIDNCRNARTGATRNKEGKVRPFWPNGNLVNETLGALKAIVQLDDKRETPFWITSGIAGELIAFPNGLLELSSDKFYSPTPDFFTLGALGFKYESRRGEPTAWLGFLDQIFDKAADKAEAEAQI